MRDADCLAGRALPRELRAKRRRRPRLHRSAWRAAVRGGAGNGGGAGGRAAGRSRFRGGGGPGVASASQVSRGRAPPRQPHPLSGRAPAPLTEPGRVTCCGAEPPAERGVSGAAAASEAARGHGEGLPQRRAICPQRREFLCCVGLGGLVNTGLRRRWGADLEESPDLCAALPRLPPRPPRSAFPAAVCGVDAGGFQGAWACLGRSCELIGGTLVRMLICLSWEG